MEPTKIQIHVSQKAALAAGRSQYGDQVVTLSDADTAALSPDERTEILEMECPTYGEPKGVRLSHVITEAEGLAGVREALQYHRAKRLETVTKEARERAKMVVDLLALPAGDLLAPDLSIREHSPIAPWGKIPWDAPELAARKAEVEALGASKRAEKRAEIERLMAKMRRNPTAWPDDELESSRGLHPWTTADEDREVKARTAQLAETRRAAGEAAEQAQIQAYRDLALTGIAGEAAQLAAGQGYDVRKAVLDAVGALLPNADATDYYKADYIWEERSSPSLESLRLRERIAGAVATLQLPEWVKLDVSRVQRITEPDPDETEDGEQEKGSRHTGVVVTISAPTMPDRYRFYYAE